ncbi:hypothetical protein FACS1894139_14500 [Planctomycetales bacterium]|nr:hypothetical protein FACS1894107_13510 [Planctomycetales bacterium]GHS97521.1 hypothetical protein FACS1894108_04030 [Planctomycetales bacterium]GHT07087.1 hypothetical protein FACS1894139_14500 [Planctomycetales bacterium]
MRQFRRLAVWALFIVIAGGRWTLADETPDDTGKTPDIFALAQQGAVADIRAALASGADVTVARANGVTPLHLAAMTNPDPAVITLLVENGAAVNAPDQNRQTPLHLAVAVNKNPAVVAALLKNGADWRQRGYLDWTPLYLAVAGNRPPEIVAELLRGGADPNEAANLADTAGVEKMSLLHIAAMLGRRPAVITALIAAGGAVNAVNGMGFTPLHLAALHNSDPQITAAFLRGGADANAANENGDTPLDAALTGNHFDAAQLIHAAGGKAGVNN